MTTPLTNIDFYKADHRSQYPDGTNLVFSNWTARKARDQDITSHVFFGLQYYIKKYLIEDWNDNFFNLPKEEVVDKYRRRMTNAGINITYDHIEALHDLGYLPLEIRALPEGARVPIGVASLIVFNTHPEFFWLTNMIETSMSATLWMPCNSATIADRYRKVLDIAAEISGGDMDFVQWQGHDFSFRGMAGIEAAQLSGAAHLLSFTGTDSVAAIDFLEDYYDANSDTELVGGSVPACYDDQTEILTEHGFVRFEDLAEGAKVAQYHPDQSISFTLPEEYFKDRYKGDMVHFTWAGRYDYIDLLVTPNHRMLELNRKTGKIERFEASERNFKTHDDKRAILVAGTTSQLGTGLTPYDRLSIAFQADGSFPSKAHKYDGSRSGKHPVRFSLKRQDKKDRLVKILNDAGVNDYTHNEYDDGYASFWIKLDERLAKDFSWIDLASVSSGWCKGFVDELQFWDGSKSSKNTLSYYSANKDCADMVQAVAVIAGYKAKLSVYHDHREDRKTQYTVLIDTNRISVGTNTEREVVDYEGYVYCVKVPTGMLVVRRNDKVVVCGNTEHSVMCMGSKDGEVETFRRLLTETYPTGIVSVVSDTWDYWKVWTEYLPQLKDTIMGRDGTLTIRPDSGDPVKIIVGDPDAEPGSPEHRGSFELAWDLFGGTVNDKGYKLIDSHINIIYGDAITLDRAKQIVFGLLAKGFVPKMILGIGSYTYQYNTRDTLGFAMKATYGEIDGIPQEIFKDPATDDGTKKSARGLIAVDESPSGYTMRDQVTWADVDNSAFEAVFVDGALTNDQSLSEIRTRLEEKKS